MKKLGVVFIFAVVFFVTQHSSVSAAPITPGSFSTTWKTNNPGTSASNRITIPTTGSGYNYNVYWEHATNSALTGSSTGNTGNLTITFPQVGTYRVDITGIFPRIYFSGGGDRRKILTVEQWGNIAWTSMNNAFYQANNLIVNATDAPNFSSVTDLSYMLGYTAIKQDINHWDVSNVVNMTSLFYGAAAFNQPLDQWDTSSVTNMSSLFQSAESFNQPLNTWDVSSVTDMSSMFVSSAFNQPLDLWNVSSVTNMGFMFGAGTPFNQDISSWDVSSVTDMHSMFQDSTSFNQDISSWNVSSVTDMSYMFGYNTAFNQPLNSWNVSNVTDMEGMFGGSPGYNSIFNQPLHSWNVSSVTNMYGMFSHATAFNQPLNSWDISNVGDITEMFKNAPAFSQSLDQWDTSSLTWASETFSGASIFNQNLSSWNVSGITNVNSLQNIFQDSDLSTENYTNILTGWSQQILPSNRTLGTVGLTAAPTSYCSTAQSARDTLTGTYSWTITDGGSTSCFTLSYTPGTNASLIGSGSQIIEDGENGTSVEVVPDAGYRFVKWSDESTANPRTDTSVTANISVTAILEADGSGTQTSSKRKQPETAVTAIASISSSQLDALSAKLQDLLVYIQENQSSIATLSPEDKQRFATLLQSIVAFLLVLLGEMG